MIKITIFFIFLIPITILAQIDTVSTIQTSRQGIKNSLLLPSTLLISGFIVKDAKFRESFQDYIQTSYWRTSTHVDDYLQYAPIVEVYVADLYFRRSKTQVFQQTKNLLIAKLLTTIATRGLKKALDVTRPDGTRLSFPSGHTSFAFTGATALYLEYRETNKFLAYSGFAFSTATGFLRITNNRHWISDVITGAGIGMLSTTLVWYINPFKKLDPFKKKKIAVYPYIDGLTGNAGLCMVF